MAVGAFLIMRCGTCGWLLFLAACTAAPPREPNRELDRTLDEIRKFRELKTLDFSSARGDEHIARGLARGFVASRDRALIALMWAGDPEALDEATTAVENFLRKHRNEHQDSFGFLSLTPDELPMDPGFRLLALALDRQCPALAARLRNSIARSIQNRGPRIPPTQRNRTEQERLRRWMAEKPDEAEPELTKRVRAENEEVNVRRQAAYALASAGRTAGLEWLKAAAVGNLGMGGAPATDLLESGPDGEREYLKLLREYRDKELPRPLHYSIQDCEESFFRAHLDVYLALGDRDAWYRVGSRLQTLTLTATELQSLIRRTDGGERSAREMTEFLLASMTFNAPKDGSARAIVAAWVDTLESRHDPAAWPQVVRLFVTTGLGRPETIARWARWSLRNGKDLAVSCDALAETGARGDIETIREASRDLVDPVYSIRSRAWLAEVRIACR